MRDNYRFILPARVSHFRSVSKTIFIPKDLGCRCDWGTCRSRHGILDASKTFRRKIISCATWPPEWNGLHQLSPPTRPSPRVGVWQLRLGPNRLKPWPVGQGVGPARQPLGALSLGSGPLDPRVKYTHVVIMILTFSQLHFVIP
jgi:hypothetical protein